jgi:hypothetical protein
VSEALRDDIMAIPNDFTETGDPDEWIGAGGEIAAITGLLTSFIDTGLSFDDFGSDGAASFNDLLGEARRRQSRNLAFIHQRIAVGLSGHPQFIR